VIFLPQSTGKGLEFLRVNSCSSEINSCGLPLSYSLTTRTALKQEKLPQQRGSGSYVAEKSTRLTGLRAPRAWTLNQE
jgi:hypothetical protein